MQVRYYFESSDALAQYSAWLLHALALLFAPIALALWGGWSFLPVWLLLGTLHIAGLRASITVTGAEVVIVKKWFLIPYKRHRAPAITDVWYGGDWGLEEESMCVVVKLGDEEVTMGTGKNMSDLCAALEPFIARRQMTGGAT